ncbi:WxL domain-containing protein [Listeria cornellensis]|uniref:Cell surface protein n=1 Tax=Listeria cornellensis FSL F6-0969 TaxID=1265820 RepID=W7CF97_9LIST|nr:WxL domain-containing protein [Listeria cornellensis]EUJ31463.1 cell surface protein [Listeria cornellensis FSL F6-0969]
MNFKKYAVVGLVAASVVLTQMNASASAAEVGSVTTNSKIQFKKQEESIVNPPVNPLDPDQTLDPADGGTTYPSTSGPLSIDYASQFDFGTQEISGETKVYKAKLDKVKVNGEYIDVPNNIQVSDNRGNNAGWHLTVAQDGQLKDGSNRSLNGAEIAITKTTPTTKTGTGVVAPTASQSIKLNPNGTASTVLDAKAEQGMGKWVANFGADNTAAADAVTLTVPGKSAKYADSEYATTLTWTLSDTPE